MTIQERMTPNRLAFLRELERIGIGEPNIRGGSPRHACLRLGWVEGVYKFSDGTLLKHSEFNVARPPGSLNRWDGLEGLAGVTLTSDGVAALRAEERRAERNNRDWLFVGNSVHGQPTQGKS